MITSSPAPLALREPPWARALQAAPTDRSDILSASRFPTLEISMAPPVQEKVGRNQQLLSRRAEAVPRAPFNVAPLFADRARGSRLWDVDGNEYLDFTGGIGTLNVGHNHPRVVDAIRHQLDRFIHTSWHVVMYEPYVRLAERLNALVPVPPPARTLFFNSGAEACENSIKIARIATGRPAVVAFERGFHGRTQLAMSLTGKVHPYTAGFGPFAPEVYRLPFEPFFGRHQRTDAQAAEEAREALDRLFSYPVEPESIAGVIMEPVLGEGGFYPVHQAALKVLVEACREHGIVFIDDEVQAGFGRCGALFACQRLGVQPDIMVLAKSLAGGVPLSAVTGRAELMDAAKVGGLGGTYGGNALACAAAHAVLDIMAEERLPERAEAIGAKVMARFRDLAKHQGCVGDVRGLGAMCALEIVDPATGAPDPGRAGKVVAGARERGLLIMTASGNVIRTLMPLTISDDDLQRGLEILAAAVAAAD